MDQSKQEPILRELPHEVAYCLDMWRNAHRPPPPRLSHYTDAAGLYGIIKSGCLWATHIYYLNDSQEFRYGCQVVNRVFERTINAHSGQNVERLRELQRCYRAHFAAWESLANTYILCFCEDANLLSQWRAYATNGNGFAIEFEPSHLLQILGEDADMSANSKLLRVIYDDKDQQAFVNLAIEQLLHAFDKHPDQRVLDCVPLVFSEMALCFKHPAFAEEQEWRLVFIPRAERFVDVRIRNGRLLPYASIQFGNRDDPPPYLKIIHGPTLEADNTKRAIGILLGKSNRYWDRVIFDGSAAPLRPR